MKSLPQQFFEFWASRDNTLLPGASEESIARFEEQRGFELPRDLRQFYEATDGTEDTLGNDIHFWPISEVKPIREVLDVSQDDLSLPLPGFESWFIFADGQLDAFFYAIHLAPNTLNAVIYFDGTNWSRVADSFAGFLNRYMHEASAPLFFWIH